jgi:hypothetical protein
MLLGLMDVGIKVGTRVGTGVGIRGVTGGAYTADSGMACPGAVGEMETLRERSMGEGSGKEEDNVVQVRIHIFYMRGRRDNQPILNPHYWWITHQVP